MCTYIVRCLDRAVDVNVGGPFQFKFIACDRPDLGVKPKLCSGPRLHATPVHELS